MVIYTVFDSCDGVELAFATKREAVLCADELTPGSTTVSKIELGAISKPVLCALYNHEGYAHKSEEVYHTKLARGC